MKISIAQRIKPFSHTPGMQCVIPGTHFILEAFPTLLRIGNLEIPLKTTPPVKGFTLQQDLERDCVWIFSQTFRIQIAAREEGFNMLYKNEKKLFPLKMFFHLPEKWERLSLGAHKAQDWDLVIRRFDLKEILPVLFVLGQKIPALPSQPLNGTARLLKFSEEKSLFGLEALCRAAFHHMLVPRLQDDQHQGFCPEEEISGNPFFLIQEAFCRIRSLFFREQGNHFQLLPFTIFESGRMTGIRTSFGSFDLEWAKGILRRAVFRASISGEIFLDLQKQIKHFHIRLNNRERGKKQKSSESFFVEEGKTYFLDRFQK